MKLQKITLALMLVLSISMVAQPSQRSITDIAKKGTHEWLSKIPAGQELNFGFTNRGEFSKAKPGKVYRGYTIKSQSAAKGDGASMVFTQQYFVPLYVGDKARILLTIANMNGKWEIVNIGSSEMAKEIGGFEKKYGVSNKSSGLLFLPGAQSDFFIVDETMPESTSYVPLQSARVVMKTTEAKPLTFTEVREIDVKSIKSAQ